IATYMRENLPPCAYILDLEYEIN
ncbi:MAG: hypothetical protein JWO10_1064, partial [Microbacteriaceae bacterium]|nr:hypothetical protein [Microbacteriaceae bacterium]